MKVIRSLFFIVVFVCSYATNVFSQQTNFENELVVPPSPNATSITLYGNIPVGESTGIPSINVPIYTWSNTFFPSGMDISLDYFAGGIRVDQVASNIGLGWSLQAGGVISRVMRGIPDETESSGAMYHDGTANKLPVSESEGNGPLSSVPNDWYFRKIATNRLDGQFDLFSYSFMGHSGQFILGKNNDVLILDKSHLKIDKTFGTINGVRRITKFKITDEKGFIYEFNDYELTTSNPEGIPPPHTSAWYLSQVVDPTGLQTINFEYENTYDFEINYSSYSYESLPVTIRSMGSNMTNGERELRSGSGAQSVNGKRIKRILLPNGVSVNFTYSNASREDLPTLSNNGLLQKIVVKTNTDSLGYHLVHDFSIGKNAISTKGRATLKEVRQFGKGGVSLEGAYKFEYYQPQFFPPLKSNKKDHWGFANSNTGGLIPEEFILAAGGGAFAPYRKLLGGQRKTDPENVKYGSLSKMTFPTGGFTEFEFEANTSNDPWLDKTVVSYVSDPYSDIMEYLSVTSSANPGGSVSFVFNGANNVTTNFIVRANPWFGPCPSGSGCGLLFQLLNNNGGVLASKSLSYPSSNANTQEVTFGINGLVKGQTYKFQVIVQGGITNYYEYVEFERREPNPPGTVKEVVSGEIERFVGGLRLKKMQDFSSSGALARTKQFDYTMEDGVTSSGSLGVRPQYSYLIKYGAILDQPPYSGLTPILETDQYIVRNSSSILELPLINGSPVVYKRVTETTTDGNLFIGKTVKHFTSYEDYPIQYQHTPPFVPLDFAKDNYGKLLKEQVYDSNNELVKETVNDYRLLQDIYTSNSARKENFRSIVISPVIFSHPSATSQDPNNPPVGNDVWISTARPVIYHKMLSFYPRFPSISKLAKSTTKFFSNEVLGLTTVTNYLYNETYNKVTSINSMASDGQTSKIDFKYTFDYPSETVSSGMLQKNMFDIKLEERSTKGGSQTLRKEWKYGLWENSYFRLNKEAILYGTSSSENKIQFLGYDTGLPKEVKVNSGPSIVYLWGYGGQYPIAKIENATYGEVVSALGSNATTILNSLNSLTVSDATITTHMKTLRDKLGFARVTNYTYAPLSGMTSMTDARGITEYYHYDGFQRLKEVLDFEKNVLTDYKYHYRP